MKILEIIIEIERELNVEIDDEHIGDVFGELKVKDLVEAVNNSVVFNPAYGASNTEMLGSNLLKAFGKPEMAGAWSTIFGLGSFVKETFDLVNLAEIYGSANMHTLIDTIPACVAASAACAQASYVPYRFCQSSKLVPSPFIIQLPISLI